MEIYLATPRGVINLSSDNGGAGNDYGGGFESCGGAFTTFDSDVPTLISTPGIAAPFVGSFAPGGEPGPARQARRQEATNADWSLLVEGDDSMGPTGTLFCWELRIKRTNPGIGRKKT